MKAFFLYILMFVSLASSAQVLNTAITADGKHVVLMQDGTWLYASDTKIMGEGMKDAKSYVLKDTTTNNQLVVEGVSAKLKKYFKYKNIVRAEFAINKTVDATLLVVNLKVQTPEAFSYFGFLNGKCKIVIDLVDGNRVELVYDEEFEPKEYPKYGISLYKTHVKLSEANIHLLGNSYMSKFTMVWKRRTEEYTLKDPFYFVNTIKNIAK